MRHWWKNPKLVGNVAYYVLRTLGYTLRVKIHKHPSIDPTQPYLFAFWHGRQLFPSLIIEQHHFTPLCAMVSPSRDGGLLTAYLHKIGFAVVRGSSRDNSVAALRQMRRKLLQGSSIGFASDGPIGPRHIVKPGVVYLAQKLRCPIIPLGSDFDKCWTFEKAWDKFQLPKPFARCGLILGEPFYVPQDMDIEQGCAELAERLHAAERDALQLIDGTSDL
ncbi:MAG TPA: lysophospholipid acyltransferase family protein [Gammaproteobacteria bacterium]|nr:lysophospholipid acyltransferase family protein [Gammaproteobacteria bacterium]